MNGPLRPSRCHAKRSGPAWLPQLATEIAERLACATRQIPGAGHTPHHTHPDVLAEIIDEHALRRPA